MRARLCPPPPPIPVQRYIAGDVHNTAGLGVQLYFYCRVGRCYLQPPGPGWDERNRISRFVTKRRMHARPLAPADGDCRAHILLQHAKQCRTGRKKYQGRRFAQMIRVATGDQTYLSACF